MYTSDPSRGKLTTNTSRAGRSCLVGRSSNTRSRLRLEPIPRLHKPLAGPTFLRTRQCIPDVVPGPATLLYDAETGPRA
jgi:hypothetical protein